MSSETRTVLDTALSIQQKLRDQQLGIIGTTVTFKIPFTETTVQDDFGDPQEVNTKDLITQILIDWGAYRAQLSEPNISSEFEIPLTAKAKIADVIPKGSKVELIYTDKNGDPVSRNFEVISADIKGENLFISKILKLVPVRI